MRCSHPCSSIWASGKVLVLNRTVTEQLPPLGLLVVTFQIQPQSTRDTRQPQPFSPAPHNTLSKAGPCLTLTSSGTKEQCSRACCRKLIPCSKIRKQLQEMRYSCYSVGHVKRSETLPYQGHALSSQHYLSQDQQNRKHHAGPGSVWQVSLPLF